VPAERRAISMYYLSDAEKQHWVDLACAVEAGTLTPDDCEGEVRSHLLSAFQFYAGTMLAAKGRREQGLLWLRAGALSEGEGLFSSAFLMGFLERHHGDLCMPTVCFADPRPYLHFTGVPTMRGARERFIRQCARTLPAFDRPLRFVDIGCGDGSLTAALLSHLVETGTAEEIGEVLLIDSSPAMLDLAKRTVTAALPEVTVTTSNHRIQEVSDRLDRRYDVAVSSLAYHHMPVEAKRVHLSRLQPFIDHFILFELDANNDTPEVFSPDLALSAYQSYGRIIDFVFGHDAPLDVATQCVDNFLMTELVSILTRPRGERTEYHMLRTQWNDLFRESLGPDFSLLLDAGCYEDDYIALFTMHYGRNESVGTSSR
jgi:SAM-dependent methyltransferase